MDDVIEFVREFAAAEWEALQASYRERDPAVFERLLGEARRFLHATPTNWMALSVPHDPAAGETPAQRELAAQYAARKIFMVKRYRNATYGDLYAAYVTSARKGPRLRYGEILYVTRIGDELKIVSRYAVATFPPRDALEWEWADGARIPDPGELVEVRRLLAPEVPAHLEHYHVD